MSDKSQPCFLCNKTLKEPDNCNWVELNFVTSEIALDQGIIPEEESQGWFPIGNNCYRKLNKIVKESGFAMIPLKLYSQITSNDTRDSTKKTRITKQEWDSNGGLQNSKLFRRQQSNGGWVYYKTD